MKSFSIEAGEYERVALTVFAYERPFRGEPYDDNWLRCEVEVRAGAFHGAFPASFLAMELQGLRQGLERLYRQLDGEHVFAPMEGQLVLRVACNRLGHVRLEGRAMDQAGTGHTLSFGFSLDQTHVARALAQLVELMQAFPVRT